MALYASNDTSLTFLGTTDRGLNQACEDFPDNKGLKAVGTCTGANTTGCGDFGKAYYGVTSFNGLKFENASSSAGYGFPVPKCETAHAPVPLAALALCDASPIYLPQVCPRILRHGGGQVHWRSVHHKLVLLEGCVGEAHLWSVGVGLHALAGRLGHCTPVQGCKVQHGCPLAWQVFLTGRPTT